MKKFRKIMAVLVAAMMIVAMAVPAWADVQGRYDDTTKGRITIDGVKDGETYKVWRMFELASFWDTNNAAGVHIVTTGTTADEAYSYVITENNPWYTWLTDAANGYAAEVPNDGNTSNPVPGQLFWIEKDTFTFNGDAKYHIIYAVDSQYSNGWDHPSGSETAQSADYLTPGSSAIVQEFAQKAVAWANGSAGTTALNATNWAPLTIPDTTPAPSTADIVYPATGVTASVPFGYYLLGTTQGTLCALDTTNPDVTLHDKNQTASIPENGKAVLSKAATKAFLATLSGDNPATEDTIKSQTAWVHNRDANIGDKVYFRTQITAMQGAKDYVLHDVMEKGFDFDHSTKGKIVVITLKHSGGSELVIPATIDISATETPDVKTNWTLTTPGYTSDSTNTITHRNTKDDFEIHFADEAFYDSTKTKQIIQDNDVITVYYSATINSDAIIFGSDADDNSSSSNVTTKAGTKIEELPLAASQVAQIHDVSDGNDRNTNSTILTYGNNSVTKPWRNAEVTVYQFEVVKTRMPQNETQTAHTLLKDAKFELYRATTTGTGTSYGFNGSTYYVDGSKLGFTGGTAAYKYSPTGTITTITSQPGTEVNINGLEAGDYLLFETEAPYGFVQMKNPVFIQINGGNDAGTTVTNESTINIQIFNRNTGAVETKITDKPWDARIEDDASSNKIYNSASTFGEDGTIKNGGIEIINKAGQELPSTGGMGTTVLYIVGGMLVILAGAYLFFSRKRTA